MGNSNNTAVLGLGTKIEAGTKQAFTTIADGLRKIAGAMSESAASMRKLGQEAPAKVFEEAAKSINNLTGGLDKQIKATKVLTANQIEAREAAKANTEEQIKGSVKISKSRTAEVRSVQDLTTGMQLLRVKFADLRGSTDQYGVAANKVFAAMRKYGIDVKVVEKSLNLLSQRQRESANVDMGDKRAKAIRNLKIQYDGLSNTVGKYGEQTTKLLANLSAYNLNIDKVSGSLKILKQRQRDAMQDDNTVKKRTEDIAALKVQFSSLLAESSKYSTQAKNQIASLNDYGNSVRSVTIKLAEMKQAQAQAATVDKASAARALQIEKLKLKYSDLTVAQGKYGAQAKALLATTAKETTDLNMLSIALAKVAKSQAAMEASGARAGKLAENVRLLKINYDGLLNSTTKYGLAAKNLISDMVNLGVSYRETSAQMAKLSTQSIAADKQSEAIRKLRKDYEALRLSQDKYGVAATKVIDNIDKYGLSVNRAKESLSILKERQDLAKNSFTKLGEAINLVTTKLRSYAGYMVASSVIFGFITGVRNAISTISDYEQSLKDLQAITRPTSDELADMATTMKKVASDTKFSAAETADGMKLLGQAGFSATETIKAIPGVTNLATGTMTEMATVTDLVTTSVRAFGLQASDTGHITDVFANAVNKSKLTIQDIKTAMNYIGPAAHNAGMSIDEVTRVMMILRDNGIKASTMATGFRQVLAKLTVPTNAFKKLVSEAGMSMGDFSVETLGISTVLGNLHKVLKTNADSFQAFGMRGSAVATALAKDYERFNDLSVVVNRSGAAAEMAEIQLQGLGNAFKNLQDNVKNIWIAMGEGGLTKVLLTLVQTLTKVSQVVASLASNDFVKFVAQVTMAVGSAKLLIMAFEWFRGTAMVTGALAAISTGVAAISSVMAEGTIATYAMTTAMNGLKLASMTFAPAAVLAAIGAVIYQSMGYTQSLKDNAVQIGVVTDRIQDNIITLKESENMYSEAASSQEDNKKSLDKLIDTFPNFATALRNAAGNAEEFKTVLADIRKEQDLLAQREMHKSIDNTAKQLADNIWSQTKYSASIMQLIDNKTIQDQKEKEFSDNNARYTEKYIQNAKALKMTDEEIVTSFKKAMKERFISLNDSDQLVLNVKSALESMNKPVSDAGREVGKGAGKAMTEGMVEGMDADAISKQAEKFNKSVESIKFKSDNQTIEKEMAARLYTLSVAEAQGVVTHEAAEMAKLNFTIDSYDKMVEAAQKYQAAAVKTGTAEQQLDAATKVDAAIEKADQVRLQKLQAFGKQREAIEGKITEATTKLAEEQIKNEEKVTAQKLSNTEKRKTAEESAATKIKEIVATAADKRIEVEKNFEAKKADLIKSRVRIEQDAAADINDINATLEDKILGIRMKGMTDKEKEVALQDAANRKLADGKKALAAAIANNDKDAIQQSKKLLESASGYYDQLSNPDAAVRGLKAVAGAMVENRKAQEQVELNDNAAKLQKEVDQAKTKIALIDSAEQIAIENANARLKTKLEAIAAGYKAQELAESNRHNKEMSNIKAEIAKLREKNALILAQQNAVINNAPSSSSVATATSVNINSPNFDMEKYERDVGIATSKGVESGVNKGLDSGVANSAEDTTKAVSNSVAEGTKEGLFKDVKVEGMPLDEWKAAGKRVGEAVAEATTAEVEAKLAKPDFKIWENIEGEPINVVINPATEKALSPLLESIKDALKKYPGEPTLDFDQAERMIKTFVQNAQRRYRIEIPVSSTPVQNKATGGEVYPMAIGGRVPGTKSPKDKVLINSRPGEWYIPDEQATYWQKSVGSWFMNAVHKPMSAAGQMLKESVLKGPNSRAVPIPVPVKNDADTNLLSSVSAFSTMSAEIGKSIKGLMGKLGSDSLNGSPNYNVTLHYSGSASPSSAKDLARMVMSELDKAHRSRS